MPFVGRIFRGSNAHVRTDGAAVQREYESNTEEVYMAGLQAEYPLSIEF